MIRALLRWQEPAAAACYRSLVPGRPIEDRTEDHAMVAPQIDSPKVDDMVIQHDINVYHLVKVMLTLFMSASVLSSGEMPPWTQKNRRSSTAARGKEAKDSMQAV